MNSKEQIDMSVVIPVYNVEDYLPDCIDSLFNQGGLRFEIILVNDGSIDRSGVIAERYAGKDGRIKVIHQENRGASAARNAGLELARGEYIAFVDSDDWVIDNSLCELYREAVKHQADMVLGNFYYYQDGEVVNGAYKSAPKDTHHIVFTGKEGFVRWSRAGAFIPMIWAYIYRKQYLDSIQAQFEEGIMYEDELWTPITLCKASKVIAINVDFYCYRQRNGSVMFSTSRKDRLKSLFRVTDCLMKFSDCFDFAGEDSEVKNWLYVDIFWLYSRAFKILNVIKDTSYILPTHFLDRFWRDCRVMMPEPQKKCRFYYHITELELKKYIDWMISEWVISVAFQHKQGKKMMLINNWRTDIPLRIENVPDDWVITNDRRYFQQAEVVVFHIPGLFQELDNDLEKCDNQIWVSWCMESEKDHPLLHHDEIKNVIDLWICHEEGEVQKMDILTDLCRKVDEMT